ncbi:MAG: hypothetical protein KGJ23_15325 [Euryarchaeota archaeon]|nr:hypothetical protein [Euryarchaeota archaeon]MDE1837971.1 hypothetical protein [Euryarchaeota archaeon]MDE2046409.1 hypothetical protein [Thermoplasmata archaeon]
MAPLKRRRSGVFPASVPGAPSIRRSIKLQESTVERLLDTGSMRDTMDTLIVRLLDEHDERIRSAASQRVGGGPAGFFRVEGLKVPSPPMRGDTAPGLASALDATIDPSRSVSERRLLAPR